MLYRLRRKNGEASPYSAGTFVAAGGQTRHLTRDEFRLTPGRRWKSYPVEWRVEIPALRVDVQVKTRLDGQELLSPSRLTPSYWEGAMTVSGTHGGVGYLEMTGYDEALRFTPDSVRK
jgi:predicted secreted hydrolase